MEFKTFPSPDDLMILLTVARLGRFTAVADALDITHTTVSRRIAALDKQLGGRTLGRTPQGWELTDLGRAAVAAAEGIEKNLNTLTSGMGGTSGALSGVLRIGTSDAFGALLAGPALVRLQREHPALRVELLSATRRLSQNRSGVDLEVVAGTVESGRSETIFLCDYFLRLYASPEYLASAGVPQTLAELQQHRFVSYVETALQVAELGHRWQTLSDQPAAFQATSIFAQLEAVRNGGGVGILPSFAVHGQPGLVPVLPDDFERRVSFWAAARPEALRSPAVQAVIGALLAETRRRREALAS